MTNPTPGRIVHYRLNANDADAINRRREHARESGIMRENTGAQVHFGNTVKEGDTFPLMVTEAGVDDITAWIGGQAFLSGNDTLWVISATQGDEPGQWTWPVIR